MSGVKLTQCLLFLVHEKGQDVTAATSSSSIRFYALLPEVFKTEYPEFLKLFSENGITVVSVLDGPSPQFAGGDTVEILEILLCATSARAVSFALDEHLPRVNEIISSNTTLVINTYLNCYPKEVKVCPAVDDNNAIIMKRILSQETNICYKHPFGESLLHLAAKRGHETFAKIILEHRIDVNSKCRNGLTPLHVAVNGGHGNVVDVLLLNGAIVGSKTNVGSTALHMAVEGGYHRIVESLLKNGADMESKTEEESTALNLAVKSNDLDMVELLLRNGADPNCRDNNGRTPLYMTGNLELKKAEVLLSYGACVDVKLTDGQFAAKTLNLWENHSLFLLLLQSCFCDPKILTGNGAFSEVVLRINRLNDLAQRLSSKFDLPGLVNEIKEPSSFYFCHIAKINAANLYPLTPGVKQIGNTQIDFKAKCESEVAQMKERTVGDTSITFFDILTQKVSQVARVLRNRSVAETLSSADLHTTFPNYAGILKWQYRKGNQKKLAIEEGVKSIDSVSGSFRRLPHEVKENILDYLSVRDILILKHAHAHTDV